MSPDDQRVRDDSFALLETELWAPTSILEGVDLDAPSPRPELLGLVYRGKLHLVSGAPESAKTWLALALGVEAVQAGGSALILDTDGTGKRDLAARLVGLGLGRDAVARVGYSDDPQEWFGTDAARLAVSEWVRRHTDRGPVVVVIDSANPTVTALDYKLDEAGFTQVEAKVIAPLKRVGAAIVLVDHVAIHAAKDSPYSISTQRKHAAADVHLRLVPNGPPLMRGGPPASFLITGQKDRPGGIERRGSSRHVGRVTFTPCEDGAVEYEVDLSPPNALEARVIFRPTRLMQRVSSWAALQTGAFSKRDVETTVPGKSQHLRQAVDVLLMEGYLAEEAGRFLHVRAYRQVDDPDAEERRDDNLVASLDASREQGAMKQPEGASPRPPASHEGSQGASSPIGRMRPEPGEGGASPASPSLGGDAGHIRGMGPSDAPSEAAGTGDRNSLSAGDALERPAEAADDYARRFRAKNRPRDGSIWEASASPQLLVDRASEEASQSKGGGGSW